MFRPFVFALSLGLLLAVAANAQPRKDAVIGAMAELSGPFHSIGDECRRGFEIAAKSLSDDGKVGEYNLIVVYGDHQRESKVGVSEFNRIVGQKHALALISNASSVVMALNPTSLARKVPFLGVSAHPKFVQGNPYAFRFWLNANIEGGALAEKALQLDKKTAAIVTLEDDYPLAVSEGFRKTFSQKGSITFDENILKTETDFSPIATRIRRVNPEIVFVNIVGDQLPLAIKKFREQGLKQQIISTFSMSRKDYLTSAGTENVEGVIFLEIDGEKPKFIEKMRELYGASLPTGLNYTCYAALGFFIEALKKNPNIQNSEELYTTLLGIQNVHLLDGELEIKDREAQLQYVLRTIKSGQVADLIK